MPARSAPIEKPGEGLGAVVLGGHAQGLGIMRSLGRRGIAVYLVDETAASIGRFSRYCHRFFRLPEMKQEKALLNFLVTLAADRGLEGWVVYPTHDATVEILSKNRDLLSRYYKVTVAEWSSVEHAYNKILTYRLAQKTGVAAPLTYFPESIDDLRRIGRGVQYPVIVKPAVMHKFYARLKTKAYKASNPDELVHFYLKSCSAVDPSEIMIQEVVPGAPQELYSCCCFYKQGILTASCIGQRSRQIPMDFGKATTFVESVEVPELRRKSEKLLSAIRFYGLAEVEFKRDPRDGVFKLLEINPRTWKWHTLAIKAGLDMPHMIYQDLLGRSLGQSTHARTDVKWVELISDLYVACGEIIKGNLKLRHYIDSLKGDIEFAIASREDPLPFIVYIALVPYFWFTR